MTAVIIATLLACGCLGSAMYAMQQVVDKDSELAGFVSIVLLAMTTGFGAAAIYHAAIL